MSSAYRYFLVAQNKGNHHFEVVKFYPEDDIYSHREKLEQLDLFTTMFPNEEELLKYLYSKKRISSTNMDLSIAVLKNRGLSFYHVLYHQDNRDLPYLREIAEVFLGISHKPYYKKAEVIVSNFCNQMIKNDHLYDMTTGNMSHIYGEFLEFFMVKGRFDGFSELKNYKGGWFFRSYSLLRNIIEAEERTLSIEKMDGLFIQNALDSYKMDERRKLKGKQGLYNKLCDYKDKNILPGQLSLFGLDGSLHYSLDKDVVKGEIQSICLSDVKAKFLISNKNVKKSSSIVRGSFDLDNNMKKNYIIDTLKYYASPKTFCSDKDNKKMVSDNVFSYPMDWETRHLLRTLLHQNMMKYMELFVNSWILYDEANQDGIVIRSECFKDVYYYKSKIDNRLKNQAELDKTFAWCSVYRDCVMKEESYKALESGDSSEKVFKKS